MLTAAQRVQFAAAVAKDSVAQARPSGYVRRRKASGVKIRTGLPGDELELGEWMVSGGGVNVRNELGAQRRTLECGEIAGPRC